MSTASTPQLARLTSAHPEWSPWLSLVEEAIAAAEDRRWENALPDKPPISPPAPLLANAAIAVDGRLLGDWLNRLLDAAARAGTPALATLGRARRSRSDPLHWLRAALLEDFPALNEIARDCEADSGALLSVAQLLPMPLLQACRRRWPRAENEVWMQSYCPLCGAWPALAEMRGIERSRYLRCGRCGEQWAAYGLRCMFCEMDDHEQLLFLRCEGAGAARSVEACKRCRGYLKSLVVLHGADARHVVLDDLASVDLDIAAIEQGFQRPQKAAYRIAPALTVSDTGRKTFFSRSR